MAVGDKWAHSSNGYDHPSKRYDCVQKEKTDDTNLEMLNTNEEDELPHPSPNGNAGGQEENPGKPRSFSVCAKYRSAIIILIIFLIIFIILIIVIAFLVSCIMENQKTQAVQTGVSSVHNQNNATKCLKCPPGWNGRDENCYKLSEEEKNWKDSQNACILQNATLAKITEEEIVINGIIWMLAKVRVFWIGLTREPDQPWKWLDGENATMEVKGNGGNCAYLDEKVTAMSVRCSTEHYYLCKKPLLLRS